MSYGVKCACGLRAHYHKARPAYVEAEEHRRSGCRSQPEVWVVTAGGHWYYETTHSLQARGASLECNHEAPTY